MIHGKCILPAAVAFVPPQCSTADDPRCAADRAAISECPAYSHVKTELHDSVQQRWAAALAGRTIAVVGDSMARQAYFTLIARLRGFDHVVDFNTWSNMQFRQWSSWDAGRARTVASDHLSVQSTATHDPKAAAAAGGAHGGQSPFRADFFFAPCWHNLKKAAADEVHLRAHAANYSHVVIFWPGFWHMPGGSCGALSNLSSSAILGKWGHWRAHAQHRPATRYTVVTAPTLHVTSAAGREQLTTVNEHLRAAAAGGALPPRWRLADFDALTHALQPSTAVPHSKLYRVNWHQACQLYRKLDEYWRSAASRLHQHGSNQTSRVRVDVLTKVGTGDCRETGNTRLWEEIIGR